MSETTVTEHTTPETGSDTPAPEVAAPSLEEELGASYDAIQSADTDEPVPPAEAEPPVGMERGADGRFVAKDAEKAAEPAAPEPQGSAVPEYIAPYVADFEARGLRPDQAVNRLLDTWRKLEQAPEQTLKWLAGQYNVPWGGQQQGAAAPAAPVPAADDVWVDPQIVQLKAELAEVKREQQMTKAERQQAAAELHAAQLAAYDVSLQTVTSEIQTFAKAKADSNFDALRPHMAALIQTGQADNLEQAYEMASWANPTTRAARIEADRKTSEAERAKSDAAKLVSARRAAFTNVTSHVASPGKALTLEETIARSYDDIAARG